MVIQTLSAPPHHIGGFIGIEKFKNIVKEHAEIFVLFLISLVYITYGHHEKQVIQKVLDNPRINDFFYIDHVSIDEKSDQRFRYIPMRVMNIDGWIVMHVHEVIEDYDL
jgi:hypothetical protein